MSQIEELEQRINAALDRVAQGVDRLGLQAAEPAAPVEPQIDPKEFQNLKEALDEEKLANAQLEERLRKLRASHEAELAEVNASVEPVAQVPDIDVSSLEHEMHRLRQSNEMLRTTNEELRGALAENIGEPHLINKAMLAELEGLRAARAVEAAESEAVLSALAPLLAQAGHGAEEDM